MSARLMGLTMLTLLSLLSPEQNMHYVVLYLLHYQIDPKEDDMIYVLIGLL